MKRIWNLIIWVNVWLENQLYGLYPNLTQHMKKRNESSKRK